MKQRKIMKIIHVIYSFTIGGSETMLVDIVNEQVKTEDVTIIIINDYKNESLLKSINENVSIICFDRRPNTKSLIHFVKLNWLIWRMRPDAVHVHNESLLAVISPIVCRSTVHTLNVSQKYLKHAKRIFAISEAVRDDLLKKGDFEVDVIPNGIYIDSIQKRNQRNIATDGCLRIIEVARLESYKKGQDILIDAVAILKERGINDVCVDFIGIGSSEESLKKQADKLGVMDRIQFLGLKDRAYIYTHLKKYDLMCHPARVEGFGLTVAEGIAAMLPVLVPDGGGPFEIIKHGELGYTFRMADAMDCANKIEYIMNNYTEAQTKARVAYKHVYNNYSVEIMVKKYIKSYKN